MSVREEARYVIEFDGVPVCSGYSQEPVLWFLVPATNHIQERMSGNPTIRTATLRRVTIRIETTVVA